MADHRGARAVALRVRTVAVRMAVAGACVLLSILTSGTDAVAQHGHPCSAKGQACYNWHQCWINRCAGYMVNCNTYANQCGINCYNYWRGYLSSQYGPIPKYCARARN